MAVNDNKYAQIPVTLLGADHLTLEGGGGGGGG